MHISIYVPSSAPPDTQTQQLAWAGTGKKKLKVSSLVPLYGKYPMTLTFENFCCLSDVV
jgi:hypothetical protein